MYDFMAPGEHYNRLVETLSAEKRAVYDSLRSVRQEACFRNRTFLVYRMEDRKPRILDRIQVLDFDCGDDTGASCEVRSNSTGQVILVGYAPVQLFDWPIFAHMPLHLKVRWSTTPDKPLDGSLAFDLVIRTTSRNHLRERGVIYCETGVAFSKEFGDIDA